MKECADPIWETMRKQLSRETSEAVCKLAVYTDLNVYFLFISTASAHSLILSGLLGFMPSSDTQVLFLHLFIYGFDISSFASTGLRGS